MLSLLLKTHVDGYTRADGTFVAPHEDKRRPAKPQQVLLSLREPTGGDQVIGFPYASGMSRKRDMEAAIESPAGLGTVIQELSDAGMTRIADAVAAGKPVFVDSGAFPAFKAAMKGGRPQDARLDFDKVFAKYNELSRRVSDKAPYPDRALLMIVAPDVVGDQVATLELVEEHREQIMQWIEAGHEVIVPFQRGPIDQYEAYLRVRDALEDLPFVVGIPSAAAAMGTPDLVQLLSHDYKPDRLHILGAVQSKRWEERMAVIREQYVDDVPGVTTDANVMRSKLHELGGLKGEVKFDKIKDILARVTPVSYGGTRLAKAGLDDEEVEVVTGPYVPVSVRALDWEPPTEAQAIAGNYRKPMVKWRGLTLMVENPVGSVRRGRGWAILMWHDYGYAARSEAVDGDEVDVYIGPHLGTSDVVYVVHQRRAGDWEKYDEDKCMLGFLSEESAKAAYLMHYDDPRFLGPITAMPVDEFVDKVKATREKPAMIKTFVVVSPHERGGHAVHGYTREGKGMSRLQEEALAALQRNAEWQHRPGNKPPPPPPAETGDFERDMELQAAWLDERAKESGFAGVEEMLMRDPALFVELAAKWRDQHPVLAKALETMLTASRPRVFFLQGQAAAGARQS